MPIIEDALLTHLDLRLPQLDPLDLSFALAALDNLTLGAQLVDLLLVFLDKFDQLLLFLEQEVILLFHLLVELFLQQVQPDLSILILALVHGLIDRLLQFPKDASLFGFLFVCLFFLVDFKLATEVLDCDLQLLDGGFSLEDGLVGFTG